MKVLLAVLMLALAALAIPSSSAALALPCQVNQSNDTVCHAEAAGCSADTYSYDVEDALNHYQASCLCVHYDNYGRPALRQDCSTPPIASAAAAPVQCRLGPTTPGGDTHCEGSVGPCEVYAHMYDVEDALNQYRASCFGCGVAIGGGGAVDCPLIGPMALAGSAAAPEVPIATHCWSAEFGSGCATTVTTAAAICTYSSFTTNEGQAWSDLSCSNSAIGYCSVGLAPVQNPPSVWCENYQPGDGSSSAALAPPGLPCQSGIAGSWCTVAALDCKATVGYQTGGSPYEYALAYCGPETWSPCVVAYADTRGNLESCLLATSSAAAADPTRVCTAGFAQTWCDLTVGPCDVRVVPWTAWGDVYAWADCDGPNMMRCYTEVHAQDPLNPEHWCAF